MLFRSGMLSGSSKERDRVVALTGLEILRELRVLLVDEELKVRKLPPHPQVPVGFNHVLSMVIYSFLSPK